MGTWMDKERDRGVSNSKMKHVHPAEQQQDTSEMSQQAGKEAKIKCCDAQPISSQCSRPQYLHTLLNWLKAVYFSELKC